ncbi:MAG: hypothetical protein WCV55_03115 [Candidatus Paceibacterota bacterium]
MFSHILRDYTSSLKDGVVKFFVLGIITLSLFASTGSVLAATLAPAASPCDISGTPFLTITRNISNNADSGNHGNWATDAFTETATVWLGTDNVTYCANANVSNGTFVTTGQPSPENGLPLSAGISGTFTGGENYIIPATVVLDSAYSTSSPSTISLPDSSIAGFSWWVNAAFPEVASSTGGSYVKTYYFSYITPNGSTWTQSELGDTGDITSVFNSTKGIGYATIQDAVNTATSSDTIVLGADMVTTSQININKSVTLDGAGHHLSATFTKTDNSNNSAIGITHSDVTIKNLIENGTGSTNLHGINIYQSTGVNLNDVTVSYNGHSGITVNGSDVTVNNITTANNAWGGINVDTKTSSPSLLTVNGVSLQTEANAAIWIDDITKDVSVADTNNQYVATTTGNTRSYFLNIKRVTTVSDDHKTSTGGTVTVVADIPAGTVIKGDSTWDGIIAPPTATEVTVTVSGFTTSVSSAIAIGSSDSDITFSKGVRLLFVGQKDQLVGWYNHAGTFSEITSVCASDDQATGDALPEGGNCKINVGSDLVVWTKHFSTFTTYTQTAITSGGGNGGHSSGSHSSGGSVLRTSTDLVVGQVLGAADVNWNNLSTEEKAVIIKSLQAQLASIIKLFNELVANGTLK